VWPVTLGGGRGCEFGGWAEMGSEALFGSVSTLYPYIAKLTRPQTSTCNDGRFWWPVGACNRWPDPHFNGQPCTSSVHCN
jgi:hypothetical protein